MLLSKSSYMNGLQCPLYLWYKINQKDIIPPFDKTEQHRLDEGHAIGKLAKLMFPQGIDIPIDDFNLSIENTKELLLQNKILF